MSSDDLMSSLTFILYLAPSLSPFISDLTRGMGSGGRLSARETYIRVFIHHGQREGGRERERERESESALTDRERECPDRERERVP